MKMSNDKSVCMNCVNDYGLKEYINSKGMFGKCDFCNRKSFPTLSFQALKDYIISCMRKEDYPIRLKLNTGA